jgi:hypothetical protein
MKLISPGTPGLSPVVGNITHKVCVLNSKLLNRRYALPRYQLIRVIGGFGCNQDLGNKKVFGVCIADAESVSIRRSDLIGIASEDLITQSMADTTPIKQIDLSLREYLVIATDGSHERGDTANDAVRRLKQITNARISCAYHLHPETVLNEIGYLSWPEGAPPEQVKLARRKKEWTASH